MANMDVQQSKTKNSAMIQSLMRFAKENQAFRDTCQLLAARERSRFRIMLHTFKIAMAKEGFYYDLSDFAKVVSNLASLGIGTLQKDANGNVIALVNIKYTLQSVGKAALGKSNTLEPYHQGKLGLSTEAPATVTKNTSFKVKPAKSETSSAPKKPLPKTIKLLVNGNMTLMPLHPSMTAEDIGNMILDIASDLN